MDRRNVVFAQAEGLLDVELGHPVRQFSTPMKRLAKDDEAANLSNDVDAAFLLGADVTFIDDEMVDAYSPTEVMMWYSGGAGGY